MSTVTTDDVVNEVAAELPEVEGRVWHWAAGTSDIAEDEGLCLGTLPPVSVFHSEGEFFATDDSCTHETYSLADGWVEDGVVECTLHMAKFDLRTGKPIGPPAVIPVATHPVAVLEGAVYVALPTTYLIKE